MNAKRIPQLQEARMAQAEFQRNVWSITVADDVTVEDMLEPEFWAHVCTKLQRGDHIEANPKDLNWYAEFIVLGKDKLWAKVIQKGETLFLFNPTEGSPDPKFTVKFNPRKQWRVLRDADVMSEDHPSKEAAQKWLKAHKKEIA